MRDLNLEEVSAISGGYSGFVKATIYQSPKGADNGDTKSGPNVNGCEYVGIQDVGAISAGTGAIGTTAGALASRASSVATRAGIIGIATGTVFLGGYNIGVAINRGIGQCGGN